MAREFNLTKLAVSIKIKRKMCELSTRELAEICGVSYPTISRIEREEGSPDMVTFIRICEWLDFDPNDFFTEKRS